MKSGILRGALLALIAVSPCGATTIIDTFSEGSLLLSFRGERQAADSISSTLVDRRQVIGNGFSEWTASLDGSQPGLHYGVDLRSLPAGRNSLVLSYWNSASTIDLIGSSAFHLELSNIVGSGELFVTLNGNTAADPERILIESDGHYEYKFSELNSSAPLDQVSGVEFWLVPTSTDFSVTVNSLSVMPEPGSSSLAILGAVVVLARRRRKAAP